MIHALAYTSRVWRPLDADDMRRILDRAARFNRMAGVTGAILYDGTRFLQYIEGPIDGITAAFGRIENSSSHKGIEMLVSQRVGSRLLPYWSMEVFKEEVADFDQILRADWTWPIGDTSDPSRRNGVHRFVGLVENRMKLGKSPPPFPTGAPSP